MLKILLMYSNHVPTDGHIKRLEGLSKEIKVVVATSEEIAIKEAPDTDVIMGHRYLYQCLAYTNKLKWVQSTAAGISHLITDRLLNASPLLTRCPIFSDVIAFHACAMAFSLMRRIPDAVRLQAGVLESAFFHMAPVAQRAMILGMGMIGKEIACLLKKMGITVIGVSGGRNMDALLFCDELITDNSWRDSLSKIDLVFIALPVTKETKGLFGEDAINALPSHSVIVSVSRAEVIDLNALCRSLRNRNIFGAALDIAYRESGFDREFFRDVPNLLITPKVSTYCPDRIKRLESFIEGQLKRYINGEPLLYEVNYKELL